MTKITKYKDKQGNTLYRFRLYTGYNEMTGKKRYIKRQGFKDEKTASDELLKIRYLVMTKQYYKDIQSGIFSDLLDEWLTMYKETVKPSTFASTKARIKFHIRPYFKNIKVDKINLRMCQDFTNKVYKKTPLGYGYIISIVKRVLDYAIRLQMIESNPMQYVIKPKKPKQIIENKHGNFYNVEELKTFLKTAKEYDIKKYTFFRLLAYTGMRKGEMLALTWKDIDLKNKAVTVNKTMAIVGKKRTIQTPKTETSNRLISLDNETINILKEWKTVQAKLLLMLGYNAMNQGQLVFSSSKNGLIAPYIVGKWLKTIAKKASLQPITVHGFRHTHASILFKSGLDVKQIQKRLGHKKIETTLDIYTHLSDEDTKETGAIFANYVNSNS